MTDNVTRYTNEKGQIGVLYSPPFGAGWSTWNDDGLSAYLCMDKTLVEMALRGATSKEVLEHLKKGQDEDGEPYFCVLGWTEIEVMFLAPDTPFYINEYDGSESVEYADQRTMST